MSAEDISMHAGRQPYLESCFRKAIYPSANDLRKGSEGFLSLVPDDMGCRCLQFYVSHPSPHNDSDNQLHFWSLGGTGKTLVMTPAMNGMEWTLMLPDAREHYIELITGCLIHWLMQASSHQENPLFKGIPGPKVINNSRKQHWDHQTAPMHQRQHLPHCSLLLHVHIRAASLALALTFLL